MCVVRKGKGDGVKENPKQAPTRTQTHMQRYAQRSMAEPEVGFRDGSFQLQGRNLKEGGVDEKKQVEEDSPSNTKRFLKQPNIPEI